MAFRGKAPGSGAGDMSKRTRALRPAVLLSAKDTTQARRMRRAGAAAVEIAAVLNKPLEEVEKALLQMRMPRPETTRGTLNITLAAHRVVMAERQGNEPLWQTFDRLIDELLRLRGEAARHAPRPHPAEKPARRAEPTLPGF